MADLWNLVWGNPEIDPRSLADAIEACVEQRELDHRTRLLIRDSTAAIHRSWGTDRFNGWLRRSKVGARIEAICRQVQEAPGFPSLQGRLMEPTNPETIRQYLRDIGTRIQHPARLAIGGAVALILHGCLSRSTEAIDVVDEVPAEVRSLHKALDELQRNYGLHLAHFQSHFLPTGWDNRLHSLGSFGRLQVSLVDLYDLFASKLFSARDKDLGDLRQLLPVIDRAALVGRLREGCTGLLAEPALRQHAERNWYVLTGETLPLPSSS